MGYPPFRGPTMRDIFQKIIKAEYGFNGFEWNSKSDEGEQIMIQKRFLKQILLF